MEFDVNIVLGTALGYLLAQLVRFVSRSKYWKGRELAGERKLNDPSVPISDPKEAVQAAVLESQADRIDQIANSIAARRPSSPSSSTTYHVQYKRSTTNKPSKEPSE